jgi:hypothetical protein
MNAAEILIRLKAFAPDTPVSVAVPLGPGGGDGHKLLPILDVYHHGLAPGIVELERGGVEIFTSGWDEPANVASATVKDLIHKLSAHPDEAHVRVAIGNGDHHRVMTVDTVGFAAGAVPINGRLPLQLFVEPWDSLTMVVRSLTTDGKGLGAS